MDVTWLTVVGLVKVKKRPNDERSGENSDWLPPLLEWSSFPSPQSR